MSSSNSSISSSPQHFACHHNSPPGPYHTCINAPHATYSESNLPPILFRLEAPASDDLPPLQDLTEHGQVIKDHDGQPLRNFPFLPRYISIRPVAWLLEYWMRTDPRLTYRDIKARMPVPPHERPHDNSLSMRRERECRHPLGLSCWTTRCSTIGRREVERVARWSPDQLQYNTTMRIEYRRGPGGVSAPTRLRAGALLDGVPVYYPLDLFLDGREAHVPGPRIGDAMSLFWQLSERAAQLRLGSWGSLPVEELPEAWRRKRARESTSEDGGEEADAW